ncbi:asparagine synthase-domain-containing protein [Aspergillus ambiguus]|uniref:asparagine synthetase domain-containing protein n=1 Tax=Aspergillus ambiguus TaxID=176160 RepID=UPI003CCCC7BC
MSASRRFLVLDHNWEPAPSLAGSIMCGIFFSLGVSQPVLPTQETCSLLRNRGPDNFQECTVHHDVNVEHAGARRTCPIALTFVSTVLSMRGDCLLSQPIVDTTSQSVLCWNGDAWRTAGEPIQGNDAELIFHLLLQAARPSSPVPGLPQDSRQRVADVISGISGAFAFVFYDAVNSHLYFGRDCLGRRSLLEGFDAHGALKICSLCDGTLSTHFEEVDTNGVQMIDLSHSILQNTHESPTNTFIFNKSSIQMLPWERLGSHTPHLKNPIPLMNKSLPESTPPQLNTQSSSVKTLEQKLCESLAVRIQNVREPPGFTAKRNAKTAVLFSGGLDCTLLARLSHELLPSNETIDLLNVAFENPRVAAAAAAAAKKDRPATASSIPETSVYESCPDRITGRAAFAELQGVCPNRNWRFVAINIPYEETVAHRDTVKRLMRPHNTEMDLSIACALYFAARGQGMAIDSVQADSTPKPYAYTTPARVLLSGLGADELFAGYSRHGAAFSRDGFTGLIDEIDLDVNRLGKRNLGRDNRVLAHWGRETRFPYLDEDFVSWALQIPVWEKCGFGVPVDPSVPPLDSEKKALRLMALRLGMSSVAREKKRAIQFGSRTAKMEKGRTKGTDTLS